MPNAFLKKNMQCIASKTLSNDPNMTKNRELQIFQRFYANFLMALKSFDSTMLKYSTFIAVDSF